MNLRHWIPFGLLESSKPHHFREMAQVIWENRKALPYAARILRHGVCDGCSLGPAGLRDHVMDGVHLCLTRLKLLSLNTRQAFDPEKLPDLKTLRNYSNEALHQLGRVPVPLLMVRGSQRFRAISWDEAFDRVAKIIQEERNRSSAHRLGFFVTSRGLTNEAYYMARKFSALMGSNHIDLCARLCHAASVYGLAKTLGVGAPTCSLKDLIGTDLVVIFGSNLANNQPVTMKYLHYAKKKGTKVWVVNPFREPGLERYWVPSVPLSALFGTRIMDDFFQVRVGGDVAFMHGILKSLIENQGVDRDFIRISTSGFEDLRKQIEGYSWKELEENSGLTKSDMERFSRTYAKVKSAVMVYSMGLTQHQFGVQNVEALSNLVLARGMIGREKCGILPIRGHSGVQGGGECGVDPDKFPGGFPVNEENAKRFSELWGAKVPSKPGFRTGQMIEAAHRGEFSLLYSIGGNLFATLPDPDFVREALSKVQLRVHQDIVLNTSTVLEGEEVLVLPTQTRYEQAGGGTSTNTERRVLYTPYIKGSTVTHAKAEWEILSAIGSRILPNVFSSVNSATIRNEMGKIIPIYKGIEKLQREGDQFQWGGPFLFAGGVFDRMPEGKARFSLIDLPHVQGEKNELYVTTRRGKQFNSMTYGSHDPLADANRNEILISHVDAQRFSVSDGTPIALVNKTGRMNGVVKISPIRPGNIQVYWPEGNQIISRRFDPISGEPDYNTFARIERVDRPS